MLVELFVRGFGLIEKAQVELAAGMTAITGETGAGKSMFVDALQVVFGGRASSEMVRRGERQAEIVALWRGRHPTLAEALEAHGIEPEGEEIVIRRVIGSDGRSRAWIDAAPVPVGALRALGEACIEVHGQHAHQRLMQPQLPRQLLDARIDPSLLEALAKAFREWRSAQERLQQLARSREEAAQEAAWLRAQLEEVEALQLEPGLLQRLSDAVEAARRRAQILEAASSLVQLLDEGDPAARPLLADAMRALGGLGRWDARLREAEEMLAEADALLEEVLSKAREVLDAPFDEAEHAANEERLERLRALLRRHGAANEEELLQMAEEWRKRLELAEAGVWDEARLRKACDEAQARFCELAERVHAARKQAAEAIVQALREVLDALALGGMQLRFVITARRDEPQRWSAHGWDEVRLEVQPNPGEPWGEVRRIASGGELSRLALALQAIGAQADAPPVAVFDEADAGIGGETAWSVGRMLQQMAKQRQVIVISHLAQVAACAAHQIAIEKRVQAGRTQTVLRVLNEEERIAEIARMLGDRSLRAQAEAMLRRGQGRA